MYACVHNFNTSIWNIWEILHCSFCDSWVWVWFVQFQVTPCSYLLFCRLLVFFTLLVQETIHHQNTFSKQLKNISRINVSRKIKNDFLKYSFEIVHHTLKHFCKTIIKSHITEKNWWNNNSYEISLNNLQLWHMKHLLLLKGLYIHLNYCTQLYKSIRTRCIQLNLKSRLTNTSYYNSIFESNKNSEDNNFEWERSIE